MSGAWRQMPERGSTTALALIHWIGTRVGRGAGRLLLHPIALYFLLTATGPRRGSRLFLRRVLDREPGWFRVFRHIRWFAATILDRVFLLAGQADRFDLRVHGGATVLRQSASGRGCILLGSHLGSFEVLRAVGETGPRLRLNVLMNVDHNSAVTRFTNALNPDLAATIIPIAGPETLLRVQERLAEGYMVGMLGDRVVADDRSVTCRFFGAEARFPSGPFLLAAMMQCPVILAFALYRGGNRYDVHFEELAAAIPAEVRRRPEDLRAWVQRYVDRLEHHARRAPYNWFNFYDFWDEQGPARRARGRTAGIVLGRP
jgi:predicted LPLAT superfamily acyltransferase